LNYGVNYTTAPENTGTSIIIECSGEAVSDNDIVQEGLIIKWLSN
jgi:hypothetical protein